MIKKYPINGKYKLKILIIGAKGYIGGRLSLFLKKKNYFNVYEITKKKIYSNNLVSLLKNIDIIINCAGADSHRSKEFKIAKKANIDLPIKIFKAANIAKVKYFFYLSTYHVYKIKKNNRKIDENSQLSSNNNYSKTKILGEKKLINFKKKFTRLIIIRPCNLFGYPTYKNKNCWKLLINNLVKDFYKKKIVSVKSKKNTYRTYASLTSFNYFIYSLINNLTIINFKKQKYFITNFTSKNILNIKDVINLVFKNINKKKIQVNFKYKNLIEEKKFKYISLYQKQFTKIEDVFFKKEIKMLFNYFKKK